MPTGSDLCWDAGLDPVLAQVAVGGDVAVVWGGGQQEDDGQEVVSTWNGGETKQEDDSPLKGAPGPQESHRLLVVLHFTALHLYSLFLLYTYSQYFSLFGATITT